MSDIPYDKLNIPDMLRRNCDPSSPKPMRLATAKGALPIAPEALIGLLTVLATDSDADVRNAAVETLKNLPNVVGLLNQRTHPKILELLAQLRPERELDERILTIRNANDRTILMICERADSRLCEMISSNHERLLITPDVLLALHRNTACSDADFERANAFLRMEGAAPELPGPRGEAPPKVVPKPIPTPAPKAAAPPPEEPVFDLEAEIEAALAGKASPMLLARQKLEMFNLDNYVAEDSALNGFSFDFKDTGEFSLEMTEEAGDSGDAQKVASIAKQISEMSPGKKIKLAYVGNKEVRNILIRDRNKQVALSVVKSGRMTDAEVLANAGNRNLSSEVLREIGANGEWMRKYPVKVAMVNNPRCPPSIAVGIVSQLQARDLAALGRNKNVSAVIFQLAQKLAKQKGP